MSGAPIISVSATVSDQRPLAAARGMMARAAAGAIMLTCAALVAPLPGAAQSAAPAGSSNSVPILSATTLQTLPAPDADQGVAVDADHYYAIDNHVIAKHRRKDGEQVDRWDGGQDGPMQHINSCTIADQLLVCANSNYSALPMGSSVEWFDTTSLRHVASHSLGLRDEGSLVWALPRQSGWIAGFAHYDRADGRTAPGSRTAAMAMLSPSIPNGGGQAGGCCPRRFRSGWRRIRPVVAISGPMACCIYPGMIAGKSTLPPGPSQAPI